MRASTRLTLTLLALLPAFAAARAADGGPDPADDEKVLRDAGVATDPAGLVAFVRSRTPSPNDPSRLSALVADLGSGQFPRRERASRELTEAGRFALATLRPALASPDPEVARRAARCIEEIEQSPATTLMAAAARLLALSKPAGATEALLGALPWIEDESAEDAVTLSVAAVGLRGSVADPAVVAAAEDKEPLRRAAAGFVLGQAGPGQRDTAVRLLSDGDARVRFRSAVGLLRGREAAAVPTLISLLDGKSDSLAWRAEELLDRLAGDLAPSVSSGEDPAARHGTRQSWEAWWKANGAKADLGRATEEEVYLGLSLIVELDGADRGGKGRVWECGRDGRPRWEIKDLQRPIDARLLPGGNVLVAEHGPPRVTERRRDGSVVWEYTPPGQPVSCQRLPNGNTFVATYNELVEVTHGKEVVFSAKVPTQMVFYAQKLRNGHCVYVSSNNHVVELDAAGKEVQLVEVENSGGWASVEMLPNGHFLVGLYNAKKVVEVDRAGKVTWHCDALAPGHATRLRNGNTLVACIEGRRVVEFDRSGKEVWHQSTAGRPFHVYRR